MRCTFSPQRGQGRPNRPCTAISGRNAVTFSGNPRLASAPNRSIHAVIVDSVAYKAGLAPGFQIIAVNGRAFTPALLRAAIDDAKGSGPAINLIVENTGYFKTISLDYHDGQRYPQLERVDNTPDRLDTILDPLTK